MLTLTTAYAKTMVLKLRNCESYSYKKIMHCQFKFWMKIQAVFYEVQFENTHILKYKDYYRIDPKFSDRQV